MAVKGYEGLLGYSRVNDAALSYYENKGPNKTDDKDKAMRQNSANVSTKNHNDIIVRAWRLPWYFSAETTGLKPTGNF